MAIRAVQGDCRCPAKARLRVTNQIIAPCFSALGRHIGETMQARSPGQIVRRKAKCRLHRRISHDTRAAPSRFAKNDVGGMEGLIGVLCTVGGALRMNAGAHGTQIGSYVREVKLYPFCAISG